ncbi:GGDEF domain-containing protein, partial [Elusimicrobiota bacterium]
KTLGELSQDKGSYERRIANLESQRSMRQRLSEGIRLLGQSLNPAEIQKSLEAAIGMCFQHESIELRWVNLSTENSLDALETWVIENSAPLVVKDVSSDERFKTAVFSSGQVPAYKSFILAPLREKGMSGSGRGIIKLKSESANRFSPGDLKIVNLFAMIGSIAFESAILHRKIEELATHDALTGLATRKVLDERLTEECAHASRYKSSLCLALMDIDHFKHFNDSYGHQVGDDLLKWLSNILGSSFRDVDFVCRYGGEEFVVVFPETALSEAEACLERMREYMAQNPFTIKTGKAFSVTISMGVATYPGEATSPRQLIRVSDERLYRAKNSGRNKIVSA